MFTNFTKIPIKLGILLVGFGLLVSGCDSTGPATGVDENSASEVTYKVTNDLGSRLTHAGDASASSARTAGAKSANYELLAQITPPDVDNNNTTTERASHVTYDSDRLYVGHMLRGDGPGNGFNGGTDVINVSNPDNPDAFGTGSGSRANALQVENVDVQESAVVGNTLFLGVAEEPSLPGEVGSSPAEVHSIELNNGYPVTNGGTVAFEDREVNANLIKAVTAAPSNDPNAFYATTDANGFYRFDVSTANGSINSVTQESANSNSQFRGLAAAARGGFALSKNSNNGNGYIWQAENNGGLTNVENLGSFSTSGGGIEDAIARVTAGGPTCNGDALVFASMNNDGFRVLKTNGGGGVTQVFSNTTLDVTSVTATQDYVYAASGEEIAVFRVDHSTICNTTLDEGLNKLGKAPVENWTNAGSFSFASGGAQVNDIAVWSNGGTDYLAIAMGRNGVFVAKRGGGTYP